MSKFINKFFKSDKEEILDSLDMLYKVVGLTLQTPKGNLDVNHIAPLTTFLIELNRYGLQLKELVSDEDNYWDNLEQIETLVGNLEAALLSFVGNATFETNQKIELVPLLEDLKKSLDLDIEVNEFKNFFKFKKLFTAGDENFITSNDVMELIPNLKSLAINGMNLFHLIKKPTLVEAKPVKRTFLSLKGLRETLLLDSPMSEVINHDQIMSIVDDLLKDEVDIPRFIIERTLINFKKNIISRHRQDAHSYKIEDFLMD